MRAKITKIEMYWLIFKSWRFENQKGTKSKKQAL
jgi:hypothetical protein